MPKFTIPVEFSTRVNLAIEAETISEAVRIAKINPSELQMASGDYVEGSFQVVTPKLDNWPNIFQVNDRVSFEDFYAEETITGTIIAIENGKAKIKAFCESTNQEEIWDVSLESLTYI